MKIYALFAMAALSAFACERKGNDVIFHGDEAKQKTDEAAKKVGEGAEKAVEGAKEIGRSAKEGAQEESQKIEQRSDERRETPPTATGGGPAGDGGTKDAGK